MKICLLLATSLLVVLSTGCKVTTTTSRGSCISGAACGCPDGSTGSQSCFSDGTYDACLCPATATAVYDWCTTTSECEALADRCQSLTITYPDTGTVSGGFCTYACGTDGDCVNGSTGETGACYTLTDLGPTDALCYERCFDDLDCTSGFRCVDAVDGAGNPLGDAICLPG